MAYFSLISIAREDELTEKYKAFTMIGERFKKSITPFLPDFVYGVVENIGVPDYEIRGCRICVPCVREEKDNLQKKIWKALKRSKRLGADVIVVDHSLKHMIGDSDMRISKGNIYPPFIFIEALKAVSALMGIDFKRCNICIADASNGLGVLMTELLLDDAAYLTLCTDNKDKVMKKLDKYILKSGISPAVVSNYKKAMETCDILIYTGDANTKEITSFVNRKMLVGNITFEKLMLSKDLLAIDEVILKGQSDPVIYGENIDKEIFLTSRSWEGALLTVSDMDTRVPSAKKTVKLGEMSRKLGLKISSITCRDRIIDRNTIYKYR